ncbi:ankyrin repeat domain-containing protein [Blastopirellula marina]|uniref:Uncharacterized protein n=1 Tax=Blastopirellula marina TaxID=124 RepID=A0A2S8FLP4_9BACT|nr:ankyrin repeat domain-containing protein [Blastopirellula marina]PQO33108.1 hypothetical protein C5Y98_18420 [Blastopirellula marina]PTL43275.1 ankyrin repeat domain-containing protein [Blastopirellula marina]
MGAFVVNFHVRSSSKRQVTDLLQEIGVEGAWICGPHGRWISFWDSLASRQDSVRIQQLAQAISQQLDAPVIAFLNHDSDFLCYWLYDQGQLLDEYNSCPGYFDGDTSQEETLAADCKVLKRYCQAATTIEQLEEILRIWTQTEGLQGIGCQYEFAEDRLAELAPCLEIKPDLLYIDYGDIGRDVQPHEIDAEWIGQGMPSDHPGNFDFEPAGEAAREEISEAWDAEEDGPFTIPAAPMHQAAIRGDIATLERLIAEGADINEINRIYVVTPLAAAVDTVSSDVVRKLVELGADVQLKGSTPESASPLYFAVTAGNVENARTLIELGADVHEIHPHAGSLLAVAIVHILPEMVELLVELGANPNQPGPNGMSPLQMVNAQQKGIEFVVKARTEAGLDVPLVLKQQIDDLAKMETLLSANKNEER